MLQYLCVYSANYYTREIKGPYDAIMRVLVYPHSAYEEYWVSYEGLAILALR